jgi:hypothetical protein
VVAGSLANLVSCFPQSTFLNAPCRDLLLA